jgi:hypothetical protein
MYKTTFFLFILLLPLLQISAAMFHLIDTTSPLLCTFASKYQNRVVVEKSKIQKVIAADEEHLSIFMEELSGQAFICARNQEAEETTLSIITESGLVQDLQVTFIDRLPEVIILTDPGLERKPENEQEKVQEKVENHLFATIEELLIGNIPQGYIPCPIKQMQWRPKKGIVLETVAQLEGADEILTLYHIINSSNKQKSLKEEELQCQGCRWIFLEANSLLPKQKILGIIAVENDE